jgi:hypothetical protein
MHFVYPGRQISLREILGGVGVFLLSAPAIWIRRGLMPYKELTIIVACIVSGVSAVLFWVSYSHTFGIIFGVISISYSLDWITRNIPSKKAGGPVIGGKEQL